MYYIVLIIITIFIASYLKKHLKNNKINPKIKPKKSKLKILGFTFSTLLIFGIILGIIEKTDTSIQSGIINKTDTSIQWTSKIDNLIWNYQYNVIDKTNNISNVIYNNSTEEEYILIKNKNSKDKIKIIPLYSNSLSNIEERIAKIFNGKIKKKYNGYEIFNIKNGKQTLIYVYPHTCYIEYYKIDGQLKKTYQDISKSIFGGTL